MVALAITPGPDMTLFLGKTVSHGRGAGFAAFLGASSGSLVHTFAVAVGLSALLAASATAFTVLKVVGCAYLLYLAYDAIRYGSSFSMDAGGDFKQESVLAIYFKGLWINLLNPKIIVFFVTFLPQFVSASDPNAAYKLMFLGVFFVLLSAPICLGLILFAERIAGFLKRSPKATRVVDWLFATVLGGFAIKLLLARAD
ncbi:MAG: LysE family translocator [Rhizobiales bacterium]|nr:LysE family translocator [Hyphomicrobiales bacterium]